jgi:hypothetical protein
MDDPIANFAFNFNFLPYTEAMKVMNSMITALGSMGGFLLVWAIFMLIYSLLGTRMFGGACAFELDDDAARLSFDSFMRAMLTLFVTAGRCTSNLIDSCVECAFQRLRLNVDEPRSNLASSSTCASTSRRRERMALT